MPRCTQLSADELNFLSTNMTASLSAFERVDEDIGTLLLPAESESWVANVCIVCVA